MHGYRMRPFCLSDDASILIDNQALDVFLSSNPSKDDSQSSFMFATDDFVQCIVSGQIESVASKLD